MSISDLNWLGLFVEQLPKTAPLPTTLFDMLGVSTRETVISNVLAYYLQENEAHGLGRLFLDSLISCMGPETDHFPSPYTVERERHNIDILIQGEGKTWAIVLENKIYHSLINPFDKYLQRVNAHYKRGVVVTLWPTRKNTPEGYANVTHKAWLDCVGKYVLGNEQWSTDERQRILYTDFVANMNTLTNALTNDSSDNEAIKLFQEHEAVGKINNLLRKQRELERYIQAHIKAAFAKYGFTEGEKRFYYPYLDDTESEIKLIPQLRFYVLDEILTEDKLSIYFELYGDATETGTTIWDSLHQFHELSGVLFDDNNTDPGVYYHLARIIEKRVMTADDFPAKLGEVIGRFFTTEALQQSLVDHCSSLWQKAQTQK